MNKEEFIYFNEEWNDKIKVTDPSREACIIYLDNNGKEISRKYFGENARIIINEDYNE